MSFTIADRIIGKENSPFIIAEMSGNHNQSLERALAIVEAAAKSGAHAIKLQTYTADTMTIDVDKEGFTITDENSLWYGRTLYDLYDEAHTPWKWHKPIMERAKQLGLLCFSTPFDDTAVDFLAELDVPCYKVASFENTDVNLLRKIASTRKPMIISTGMASLEDLELMVSTVRTAGCNDFVLLKCTSAYPALPKDCNLVTIPDMRNRFNCEIGLSDHTLGIGVAVASVALGATVIEKHFTLSRAEGGVDAAFSLEPEEMKKLTEDVDRAWQALGKVNYAAASQQEKKSLAFRRSVYVVQDVAAGEILTRDNLRCIRPGFGLAPKYYEELLGKRAVKKIEKGTAAAWELFE